MTTTFAESRVLFTGSEVATPRLRTTARRILFWILIVLIVLIVVGTTFLLTGSTQDKNRLSATNPHSNGAEALIAVLRADGVGVSTPQTLGAARQDTGANPGHTTLVVYDQNSILSAAQFRTLVRLDANLVLIEPDSAALGALAPNVSHAGALASAVQRAGCALPIARRAADVSGLAHGYRITTPAAHTIGCFGSGGVYALAQAGPAGHSVTVIGATTTFTNGAIEQRGNAALALGLFGQSTHLVWYLPTLADAHVLQDGVVPTPQWVLWTTVLGGLVLVAAGVWRGRRLGPVVVERMPVFVRASETREGRSRLYQRFSTRPHALDALRIGAIGRMATACGLSGRAGLDEVIGAIARITGTPAPRLRELLVDAVPNTDADLVRLSDELTDLEATVATAVRPQ